MFACIALGRLFVLPHLWQHSLQVLDANAWEPWHTAWWALSLAVVDRMAPGLIAGDRAARDGPYSYVHRHPPGLARSDICARYRGRRVGPTACCAA